MNNDLVTRLSPLRLVLKGFSMATRVIEELLDDLDNSTAEETVQFSYRGVSYEIDLSDKNAAKLDKALAPYVQAARTVKQSRIPRTAARSNGTGTNPKAVREWAKSAGIEVSERGRVPADVIRQYQEA